MCGNRGMAAPPARASTQLLPALLHLALQGYLHEGHLSLIEAAK